MSEFLLRGFTQGFSLNFHGTIKPFVCDNLKSFRLNPDVAKDKIDNELKLNRIAGPFKSPPFSNFHQSPLGLVPKRDGKFRLIHHLSYPAGESVNDGIPEYYTSVKYQTLDNAIDIIQKLGKGCLIAKADIQDAFRLIPIRSEDHHLLGFKFEGNYYYDKSLPMGSSGSCQLFEKFSQALHWALCQKYRVQHLVHILDDFMFFGLPGTNNCMADLCSFLKLANYINLPIKPSKTVFPTTVATLFGIEVDTISLELRLPNDKLVKLKSLLDEVTGRHKITVRTLQALLGHLNFACLVIVPGRTFMRRLQNLLCKLSNPKPLHWVRLSKEAQLDIAAWKLFIESHFHGKSILLNPNWTQSYEIELFTDAAQSVGCAAVYRNRWFAIQWPGAWKSKNIALLELFPIVVALETWGPLWSNHQLCFRCDNQAVVHIINKQTAKDHELMKLLRKLVLSAMKFNVNIKARHIPGLKNVKADMLSRFQIQRALETFPELDREPVHLPTHLLPTP